MLTAIIPRLLILAIGGTNKTCHYATLEGSISHRPVSTEIGNDKQDCVMRTRFWKLGRLFFALAVALGLPGLRTSAQVVDYTYTIVNGTITITQYIGPGGATTVPSEIAGLPVTSIGGNAFSLRIGLTSVTIPDSVTSIGWNVFLGSTSLTSVKFPDRVTSFGNRVFDGCASLTSVKLPDGVNAIGERTFYGCSNLTSVTIPDTVTNIEQAAFDYCTSLTELYFQGKPPSFPFPPPPTPGGVGCWTPPFHGANHPTVYYLPGTTGWGTNFAGLPTALWLPKMQATDPAFGVWTNQFGFNITWARGLTVVVEASSSLLNPTWSPVSTNTLSDGTFYFSDPQWTNYPGRFYRIRSQ